MANDVIVSRLFGGTGNQLFQYAAGRALADHHGCELVLDARYAARIRDRGTCFKHFNKARHIPEDKAPKLPPAKQDGLIRYKLWRLFGRNSRFVRERDLGFDPAFFDNPPGTYLHGYWQSQKYFDAIAEQIRADLTFTTPLNDANAAMATQIAQAGLPVALHVRRGDYTASGAYAACPPDYYRAAADHIHECTGKPLTCFIFSNDPGWAKDNLGLGHNTIVVDINDEATGHFDLHLQSLCAHNVIANSTFSWWAAWLNRNPEKIVVAPKNWFGDTHRPNPDICPPEWTRL